MKRNENKNFPTFSKLNLGEKNKIDESNLYLIS